MLLAFYFLLARFGNRPKRHMRVKLENLRDYLEVFFFRGVHLSVIVIDIMGRDVFIQFSKLLTENNDIHIECVFPIASWSKKYESTLYSLLKENGYKFQKKHYDYGDFNAFIVKPGDDVESIFKFARLLLIDLFKLTDKEMLSIIFGNISQKLEIHGKTEDKPSKKLKSNPIPISIPQYYGYKFGCFIRKLIDLFFGK